MIELSTIETATPIEIIHQGVPMMDASEARACVTRILTRIDIARGELLELKDREGWRALGYRSWGACAKAEFGGSAATLYRQLEAAEIARGLEDSQFENLPTSHLQAVKELPPAQAREALEAASTATNGKPTAKAVQQAAAEIAAPDLPIDFSIVQRRLAAHGVALTSRMQGQHLAFTTCKEGMIGITSFDWSNVTDRLERMEQAPAPDPAHVERLEAQIESDRIPEAGMVSLSALDASLPKALSDLGYFWQSATPPTIAHNDGWRADAPTVDQALALVAARQKMRTPGAINWNAVAQLTYKLGREMHHYDTDRDAAMAITLELLQEIAGADYVVVPPFPTKDLPTLMDGIGRILRLFANKTGATFESVAPALSMLKAIGRKALEAAE